MHRFLIVIEKAGKNFSAYSPDLPGCVATGKTREDAKGRYIRLVKNLPNSGVFWQKGGSGSEEVEGNRELPLTFFIISCFQDFQAKMACV